MPIGKIKTDTELSQERVDKTASSFNMLGKDKSFDVCRTKLYASTRKLIGENLDKKIKETLSSFSKLNASESTICSIEEQLCKCSYVEKQLHKVNELDKVEDEIDQELRINQLDKIEDEIDQELRIIAQEKVFQDSSDTQFDECFLFDELNKINFSDFTIIEKVNCITKQLTFLNCKIKDYCRSKFTYQEFLKNSGIVYFPHLIGKGDLIRVNYYTKCTKTNVVHVFYEVLKSGFTRSSFNFPFKHEVNYILQSNDFNVEQDTVLGMIELKFEGLKCFDILCDYNGQIYKQVLNVSIFTEDTCNENIVYEVVGICATKNDDESINQEDCTYNTFKNVSIFVKPVCLISFI